MSAPLPFERALFAYQTERNLGGEGNPDPVLRALVDGLKEAHQQLAEAKVAADEQSKLLVELKDTVRELERKVIPLHIATLDP